MKKTILIFSTLLFFCAGNAQQIKIGVRSGVNLSNWKFSGGDSDFKTRITFSAGLLAEIPISKNFFLQPELDFSGYGTRYNTPQNVGSINLIYLSAPVLAKYVSAEGFSFFAGPQFSFLADSKRKDNVNGKTDVKEYLRKTDFMILAGTGYEHRSGLFMNLRYYNGLTDIYKDNVLSLQNRALLISVGYKLARKPVK